MDNVNSPIQITAETTRIVAAYLSQNRLSKEEIPSLIETVYASIASLGRPQEVAMDAVKQEPAVPIKRSVTPDFIICLEDGKKLKMLKRHLKTAYDMTPEEYRAKWGLPPDYPMTAPKYAAKRSELAKQIGLGRMRPAA